MSLRSTDVISKLLQLDHTPQTTANVIFKIIFNLFLFFFSKLFLCFLKGNNADYCDSVKVASNTSRPSNTFKVCSCLCFLFHLLDIIGSALFVL